MRRKFGAGGFFGYSGWYTATNNTLWHFRSLKELSLILEVEKEGNIDKLINAEIYKIPYIFEGVSHNYHPDFLLGNELIEIKMKSQIKLGVNQAKAEAAKIWCEKMGFIYSFRSPKTPTKSVLKKLYKSGQIKIESHLVKRFKAFVKIKE